MGSSCCSRTETKEDVMLQSNAMQNPNQDINIHTVTRRISMNVGGSPKNNHFSQLMIERLPDCDCGQLPDQVSS